MRRRRSIDLLQFAWGQRGQQPLLPDRYVAQEKGKTFGVFWESLVGETQEKLAKITIHPNQESHVFIFYNNEASLLSSSTTTTTPANSCNSGGRGHCYDCGGGWWCQS